MSEDLEKREDGFLHRKIDVGEVSLHVAEARPRGGVRDDTPLVVLLHGFPEFYWSWRHQLAALSAAGYWAVAPDMRGYNESDKPEGVESYAVEKLAGDVSGLIRALGRERAHVVGHDWGGAVAWAFGAFHPSQLDRLVICNCPHPLALMRAFRTAKQLRKSWYMFFFQLPRVPERLLAKDDYAYVRRTFRSDGVPASEIEPYVDAMRVPGAATAAINYYRASLRRVLTGDVPKTLGVEAPVLVVWGDADKYLGVEMAEPPKRFCPNARVVFVPGASHWVQNAAPERVSELLVGFFDEARAGAGAKKTTAPSASAAKPA